ncbi:MAG: hypothetical protein NZ762_06465, partial [Dehalococcoidia bacterium]|nr:hypothetical protein [Dehalococcoidia bacterium]
AGADLACGTAVGEAFELLEAGSEVAEDPQANSRATNSRTMALGRYLLIRNPSSDIGILDSPLNTSCDNYIGDFKHANPN